MKITNILILALLVLTGCNEETNNNTTSKENTTSPQQPQLNLQVVHSFVTDTNEHYRGLDIHNEVAYIAGSLGTIYTLNLQSEKLTELYSSEGRHLRDIDILDNGDIVALAITEPAQILFKEADLDSFKVVYEGKATAFLDGIDFWNEYAGIAFGDPLNGYPYVLQTEDGGRNWNRIPKEKFPNIDSSYAGFAASGTSIVCLENGKVTIGLGNETAKTLHSEGYGKENWFLQDVTYHQEPNGSGIYSIAFKDHLNGVAVGGHWQNTKCDSSKVYTNDGGKTWLLAEGIQEYRSCATYLKDDIYISTGTTGTDISYDGGKTWKLLDSLGYNAINLQDDGTGVAIGNYGKIDLLKLSENH